MKKCCDFRISLQLSRTVCSLMTLVLVATSCGSNSGRPSGRPTTADAHDHEASHPSHHEGHHHRFDDAARWSKVFDDPERDAWQKPSRIVELMRLSQGMLVADVGAGTGYF